MKFEVETAALNSAIDSVENELQKMDAITKRLYTALTDLDGMWEGIAHDTFRAQYAADQVTLAEMRMTIGRVVDGLESARKTYEHCEESVKTEIRKIMI